MKKRLILGLEKKRFWQLPFIAVLLALFAGAIWCYANWLGAGTFDVWKLVEQGNTRDLADVLRWRPGVLRSKDVGGRTLLHYAIQENQPAVVKVLIQAAAKANAKLEVGDTTLEIGLWWNHPEIVEALIAAGANIYPKDRALWRKKESELLKQLGARTRKQLDAEAKQGKK